MPTVEIIALQEYTDQYISLYQGEIRNISQDLADRLIEEGIVAPHQNEGSSDGSSSSDGSRALTLNANWGGSLYNCFLINGMPYNSIKTLYDQGIPIFIRFNNVMGNFCGKMGIIVQVGINYDFTYQTTAQGLRVLTSSMTISQQNSTGSYDPYLVTFIYEKEDNTIRSRIIDFNFLENFDSSGGNSGK